MACPKCGRVGLCRDCCCVNPDHKHPFLKECRLCHHPTDRAEQGRN